MSNRNLTRERCFSYLTRNPKMGLCWHASSRLRACLSSLLLSLLVSHDWKVSATRFQWQDLEMRAKLVGPLHLMTKGEDNIESGEAQEGGMGKIEERFCVIQYYLCHVWFLGVSHREQYSWLFMIFLWRSVLFRCCQLDWLIPGWKQSHGIRMYLGLRHHLSLASTLFSK